MALLRTYRMKGLTDFVLQLYDEVSEDRLWNLWINKDVEENWKDFKKKHFKALYHGNKVKALTKEQEKQIIENNIRFIKPTNKGGETVNEQ